MKISGRLEEFRVLHNFRLQINNFQTEQNFRKRFERTVSGQSPIFRGYAKIGAILHYPKTWFQNKMKKKNLFYRFIFRCAQCLKNLRPYVAIRFWKQCRKTENIECQMTAVAGHLTGGKEYVKMRKRTRATRVERVLKTTLEFNNPSSRER